MPPIAIDLFCGLGGWTEGLLAEGYRVVGFDNERHVYGEERYPAQLVLQDVLTIHGRQFKDAALIVASPPCQAYSYRAMPWKRAKALPPPDNGLFEACFRIQREAIEAAGHFIPLVVENVRGAQPYVGRSKYHFGSFHLWGDVPALMPLARKAIKVPTMGAGWYPPDHPKHVAGLAFNGHAARNLAEGVKAGDRNKARASGGHEWSTGFDKHMGEANDTHGRGSPSDAEGCSLRSAETAVERSGDSFACSSGPNTQVSELTCPVSRGHRVEVVESVKGADGGWFNDHKRAGKGPTGYLSQSGSKSPARKRASAMIAKIPLVLSRHIAQAWYPQA